jgi:hypothetical protein
MFDRLLTLNCSADIIVPFKIDELLQAILFRETAWQTVAMFVAAAHEIAGDPDVKCAVAAIAHYVNEAATHHSTKQDMDGRDFRREEGASRLSPGHDIDARCLLFFIFA